MSFNSSRRPVAKAAVILASGGLVVSLAIPAYAHNSSSLLAATEMTPRKVSTQTFETGVLSAELAVSRDGYSATKRATVTYAVNKFVTLNPPAQTYSGEAVIAYGMQFVGVVPYGYGNSPTTSFSCDGFTQYVLKGFGIYLPRTADAQARYGVRIDPKDARPGDLLWYPHQHIAFYAGNGMMLDSPRPGRYVELHPIWGNPIYLRLAGK
ncbi:MAG: C40 family peptidase [Cryobacterium sp.]|nr:C40 family peptidase [Cryobacterium sp.]MBX3090013.1 C40 family peptidase [Cryobacterium sp.]MCO5293389.1 C40 family peptidase [Homoserinimonas sp.]